MELARNDLAQYDQLANEWWKPRGQFAMLHWIAASRAEMISPAKPGALLVDLGCGGGLMHPHVTDLGYRSIGVDLVESALIEAKQRGSKVVRARVEEIPIASNVADVVVAGELLEHVHAIEPVVAEICRILMPGGLVVIDAIANTRLAKLLAIDIAERVPGGAPRGIHDAKYFVDRAKLIDLFAARGVSIELRGIRPSLRETLLWMFGKREFSRMVPTFTSSVLFQAWGHKSE